MHRSYLKTWDWDLIFGPAVKAISSPGVRSPCPELFTLHWKMRDSDLIRFFQNGTQIKIPSEVIQPLTAFIAPALARVKQLWSGEFN